MHAHGHPVSIAFFFSAPHPIAFFFMYCRLVKIALCENWTKRTQKCTCNFFQSTRACDFPCTNNVRFNAANSRGKNFAFVVACTSLNFSIFLKCIVYVHIHPIWSVIVFVYAFVLNLYGWTMSKWCNGYVQKLLPNDRIPNWFSVFNCKICFV